MAQTLRKARAQGLTPRRPGPLLAGGQRRPGVEGLGEKCRELRGAERPKAEARVLSVLAEMLYSDLAPEELARAARLPAVTAGRSYSYPRTSAPTEQKQETSSADDDPAPEPDGARSVGDGVNQCVILHRDAFEELREALGRMGERLDDIEDVMLELVSRPIAEFDVRLVERRFAEASPWRSGQTVARISNLGSGWELGWTFLFSAAYTRGS